MRPQGETRVLPVVLTPQELAAKSQELAQAVVEVGEQRRYLEDEKSAWSMRRKAIDSELSRREKVAEDLAGVVETGLEERTVGCSWLYALAAGWAFLVRNDTQELIDRRELEDEERQESLVEVLAEPTPEQLAEWLPDPMGEELEAIAADKFQAGPGALAPDPDLLKALKASTGLEDADA